MSCTKDTPISFSIALRGHYGCNMCLTRNAPVILWGKRWVNKNVEDGLNVKLSLTDWMHFKEAYF